MKKLLITLTCTAVPLYGMETEKSGVALPTGSKTEYSLEKLKNVLVTLPSESTLLNRFNCQMFKALIQPHSFSLAAIKALAGKQMSVEDVIAGATYIVQQYQREERNSYLVGAMSSSAPSIIKMLLQDNQEVCEKVMAEKDLMPLNFSTTNWD